MTEDEARAWVDQRFGADAVERLATFAELVAAESTVQNLVSAASLGQIWSRHIVDSAQLVPLAPEKGIWLDIGTGAGFPGVVIALLRPALTLLVEPRRRRADFLTACAQRLGVAEHVRVVASKVENVVEVADVISARAVAPIENLLQSASQCAKVSTRWLLPRGRLSPGDLEQLRQRWTGLFHVEQSLTDAGSSILVADRVRRR